MACTFCAEGASLSSDWYSPEEKYIRKKMGNFYVNHSILSRAIFIPAYALAGALKPILFPIMSALGVLLMPLIALGKGIVGKTGEAIGWLHGWIFSVMGVGISIAFLGITAYYLPLSASAGIFIGLTAISIIFHVYRASKVPLVK